MLFCFSAQQQKEEEHVYLVEESADDLDQDDSEEAHDNLLNQELLVASAVGKSVDSPLSAAARRSNHRRTLSGGGLDPGPLKSPIGTPLTPRTFRKSQTSAALGAAASAVLVTTAGGKFVDPLAVSAVAGEEVSPQHQHSAASSASSLSRKLSQLGPGAVSFFRRNLSQSIRNSKGTEHLQREALRKSNETAAGLGVDQSQRYIKLPTSSAAATGASSPAPVPSAKCSQQQCSPLPKSATSAAIVAIGSVTRQQQQQQPQSPSAEFASLLSVARSDRALHHRHRHHSPASSASSGSSSSASSPPPPTLVPRSANNPPPRPKTSKPTRNGSAVSMPSSTGATSCTTTSLAARHQLPLEATVSPFFTCTSTSCTMTSTVTTTSTMCPLTCTTSTSAAAGCSSTTNQTNGANSNGATGAPSSSSSASQPPSSSAATSSSTSSSSSHHHHQHQQFINKPPRGWLHPDHKLSDSVGVAYAVRYIGCLGVNTSMKSLDFDTRSLIAKECINRVCEAAGLKTVDKKRRTDKRIARMLAEAPNMDHAGVDVNLSITSAYLNLIVADSGEQLARHEMPNISFASGGDTDTLDFAAYVAKDSRFGRACFVLECGGGRAQDVITTIGQAFELRFKEFLKRTPRAITDSRLESNHFNGNVNSHPRADDREYYNDLPGKIPPDIVPTSPNGVSGSSKEAPSKSAAAPHAAPRKKNGILEQVTLIDLNDDQQQTVVATNGNLSTSQLKAALPHDPQYVNCMSPQEDTKDPFDMQPFVNAIAEEVSATTSSSSIKRVQPVGGPASQPVAEVEFVANSDLDKEDWFHGPISRKQSEELVIRDGDFLVRESQVSSGQYVLTGMQSGSRKHLLLVDPEGVVRTKDKTFESVSHLINYHRNNGLPIISSESALILKNPIVAPKFATLKAH